MTCKIRLGELYSLAYEKDPKRASNIKEMWENSMMCNKAMVFGLQDILDENKECETVNIILPVEIDDKTGVRE